MRGYHESLVLLLALVMAPAVAEPVNLAASGSAEASSRHTTGKGPEKAIDGDVSDGSRWVSAKSAGPHWLEVTLPASFEIGSAHVYSGYGSESPIRDFTLESWDGTAWQPIPGGSVRGNTRTAMRVIFTRPVDTTRVRLIVDGAGPVRVKDLLLFAPQHKDGGSPKLGFGTKGLYLSVAPDLGRHYIMANQCGYDVDGAKRFTAPNSPDGSVFVITHEDSPTALFEGVVRGGVGDFTAFEPDEPGRLYVIRVTGGGKADAVSDPFEIGPLFIERLALRPALRFMIDSRSIAGTHPSAYGGTPWRDGVFYTYEMPSLVLLYLSNPAFFEALPPEIDYAAEKARVLDPGFNWVRAKNDADTLDAARRYYRELDAPVGHNVPDIVQLIHFGAGMWLMDPKSKDPSGGSDGDRIHTQTVEQFAYFLYAYPEMQAHFTPRFYEQVRDFAFDQWEQVGLLEVIMTVGQPKGRHCPGHSIMPNLMMYEVAKREGRADADRYLAAAAAQARWVVKTLDPADPRVTKGQRMSEHKLPTGLLMLAQEYPEAIPDGLDAWLTSWARVAIGRSDNLYDFRQYDDSGEHWTLPKPWNEPGNIAGFPGLAVAVGDYLDDPTLSPRLEQLAVSHYDNIFGRNPLQATSSQRGAPDYPGIERGFPKKYGDNICARLELCRGTLNSCAASEHYPFDPTAGFRHPEGWTAFNAAFNVSLAYTSRHRTIWSVGDAPAEFGQEVARDQPITLTLTAPIDTDPTRRESIKLPVWVAGQLAGTVMFVEAGESSVRFTGTLSPMDLGAAIGDEIEIAYGHGFMARRMSLRVR